ncbi:hypothetical protein PVAND_012268 [Polypedilum vanderplanki]|uniref:Zinc finger protein n=1 Tax=Polypedilum vanderplanki TaxID=319348 RepID=A0A9J6CM74_POLVA|nr:hypothetical protein PVAND_012268 [Polypedilum vanderplanki]
MSAIDTLENRCRICALIFNDSTCSIPIFSESSANFFLQRKIEKYLYITVLEEDDLLPKKICATCFLKIESIDKFAFAAAKNQENFLTWLKNSHQSHMNEVQQTTIETSTNSDFSFSNITIKKEFNHRQQIVIQPQKSRNARHVDHITLEQIINDQIIKNPKLPASTTITRIDESVKRQRIQNQQKQKNEGTNISIVSYNNLQIGQVIKDYELLKLILRALKWEEFDRKASYNELIERLKRSHCRDILTNKNLLSDNDVVQLLRSYVNDSMMNSFKAQQVATTTTTSPNVSKILVSIPSPSSSSSVPSSVASSIKASTSKTVPTNYSKKPTQVQVATTTTANEEALEVAIDPDEFLAATGEEETVTIDDEEEETTSAVETKIETAKLMMETTSNDESGDYICSSCPQKFSSSTDLQNHVTNHLISSASSKNTTNNNNNNNNNTTTSKNGVQSRSATKSAIAETITAAAEVVEQREKTPVKKKVKTKDEKLRPKRKKIVIRINPSPKRNNRERARAAASQFSCPICAKGLSSKRNVQLHIDTHKNKSGKFACENDNCKKAFGKMENLLKHKQEAHSTKRKKNQNEK